jgi:hypothetical protein
VAEGGGGAAASGRAASNWQPVARHRRTQTAERWKRVFIIVTVGDDRHVSREAPVGERRFYDNSAVVSIAAARWRHYV